MGEVAARAPTIASARPSSPPEIRYGTCSSTIVEWAAPTQPSRMAVRPSGHERRRRASRTRVCRRGSTRRGARRARRRRSARRASRSSIGGPADEDRRASSGVVVIVPPGGRTSVAPGARRAAATRARRSPTKGWASSGQDGERADAGGRRRRWCRRRRRHRRGGAARRRRRRRRRAAGEVAPARADRRRRSAGRRRRLGAAAAHSSPTARAGPGRSATRSPGRRRCTEVAGPGERRGGPRARGRPGSAASSGGELSTSGEHRVLRQLDVDPEPGRPPAGRRSRRPGRRARRAVMRDPGGSRSSSGLPSAAPSGAEHGSAGRRRLAVDAVGVDRDRLAEHGGAGDGGAAARARSRAVGGGGEVGDDRLDRETPRRSKPLISVRACTVTVAPSVVVVASDAIEPTVGHGRAPTAPASWPAARRPAGVGGDAGVEARAPGSTRRRARRRPSWRADPVRVRRDRARPGSRGWPGRGGRRGWRGGRRDRRPTPGRR